MTPRDPASVIRELYRPGTREEIRARFKAAQEAEGVPPCIHSKMDWKCIGCLWGQLERSEYCLADYAEAFARVEQERDELRETMETRARLGYPASWARLDAAEARRDAAEARADALLTAIDALRAGAVGRSWHVSVNRDAYARLITLAAVDEPPPSEPEIPLGRGHARAQAAEDIGSGSLSGEPPSEVPDWVRCNRCGWAWDENDPDSLVCPCLDKYGYRTVTQLPGTPLSKDTG